MAHGLGATRELGLDAFARRLPEADPRRAVLWGFSFSGGHVMALAAEDLDLSAGIAQLPFASGSKAALCVPPRRASRS